MEGRKCKGGDGEGVGGGAAVWIVIIRDGTGTELATEAAPSLEREGCGGSTISWPVTVVAVAVAVSTGESSPGREETTAQRYGGRTEQHQQRRQGCFILLFYFETDQ